MELITTQYTMDVCQEVNITKSIQCMVADYLLIHRFNENRAILQHFVEGKWPVSIQHFFHGGFVNCVWFGRIN